MPVRVVTDSTADLPPEIARELGIAIVPCSVAFGQEVYRDGMDLSPDAFYLMLASSTVFPVTSQPSAGDFLEVYQALSKETDAILSIHLSAKLSGTYQSALAGREKLEGRSRIEIVDSFQTSTALGLLALRAARAAAEGASLDQVVELTRRDIPRTHLFAVLDTLEYVRKGGRISHLQAFLGTMLQVKPILTCRGGEVHVIERMRTRKKALEKLVELTRGFSCIEELAVMDSNVPEEAEVLLQRLSPLFPVERIYRARIGSVLGAHAGPGALGVALVAGEG